MKTKTIILERYCKLLKAVFYGRPERYPNLGVRRRIKNTINKRNSKLKGYKYAIWHKDIKKWLDTNGKEYKESELEGWL